MIRAEERQSFINMGKEKGATAVVICLDGFDYEYYCCFAGIEGQTVESIRARISGSRMDRVVETIPLTTSVQISDEPPLAYGDTLEGFCAGFFGRDSYGDKIVQAVGPDWIVAREEGRPVFCSKREDGPNPMVELLKFRRKIR